MLNNLKVTALRIYNLSRKTFVQKDRHRTSHAREGLKKSTEVHYGENTGDHNASRLVKIQISTTISKFRSAALLGRFRRPRCGSKYTHTL